jgi:Holliday junction resolvase
MSCPPLGEEMLRQHSVRNTLSQAWRVGQAVVRARCAKADPVAAIIAVTGGVVLVRGKTVDVKRYNLAGYAEGHVDVAGHVTAPSDHPPKGDQVAAGDERDSRVVRVAFRNENVSVRDQSSGKVLATVPDIITIVDAETGEPVMTEEVRYGLSVCVLVMPAPAVWRTALGLKTAGPRAFGVRVVDETPVEGGASADGGTGNAGSASADGGTGDVGGASADGQVGGGKNEGTVGPAGSEPAPKPLPESELDDLFAPYVPIADYRQPLPVVMYDAAGAFVHGPE